MIALHRAILRFAAILVPAELRAEWLAEWHGELFHASAEPRANTVSLTAFCLGSFRDALWLRWHHAHRLHIRSSPAGCLAVLALIALSARAALLAADPVRSYPASGMIVVVVCALLITSVGTPLTQPMLFRSPRSAVLRGWLFLLAKLTLILATLHYCLTLIANSTECGAGAVQVLLILCSFAFRWALRDQRARCPVCLRRLTNPVRVAESHSGFLGWNGIEMACSHGHGLLYVPESPSDHYYDPRWVLLDPSWRVLFDSSFIRRNT